MRTIGNKQHIKGEIRNLCLYVSEFNPNERNSSKYYVISPCDISLNGASSDCEETGLNASLVSSTIKISVSPCKFIFILDSYEALNFC